MTDLSKLLRLDASDGTHVVSTLADLVASSGGQDSTKFLAGDGTFQSISIPPDGVSVVSSGVISGPVSYLDVPLPSGYSFFNFNFSNFSATSSDVLAGAVSVNGGSTFFCDHVNGDTYTLTGRGLVQTFGQSGPSDTAFGGKDSLFYISNKAPASGDILATGTLSLWPGLSTSLAIMKSDNFSGYGGNFARFDYLSTLNPSATVTPTPARVNLLRVLPYGNGDIPPTSTNKLLSGTWSLVGIV